MDQPLRLRNEFASVEVAIDPQGYGERVRFTDLTSGACVHLDPLQLESLVWLPASVLAALADPAFRWSDETQLTREEVF